MRTTVTEQLPLMPGPVEHEHARVLQKIDELLEATPTIAGLAYHDLSRGECGARGRGGMSADRAVRACVLKVLTSLSYAALEFALKDSRTYRIFFKLGIGEEAPSRSALQANVKLLSARTLELINREIVAVALREGVEHAERVRADCTVVEANIHKPSDSSLLWDTTRTLTRLMARAREYASVAFEDRSTEAKRTNVAIFYGHKGPERDAAYVRLMAITTSVCDDAERVASTLRTVRSDRRRRRPATRLAERITHHVGLGRKVIGQTQRRVVDGEQVPAQEKILSIFEPHTDVIVPSTRQAAFGHKVCLTVGQSALVLDAVVEDGAPADSTLAVRQAQRVSDILGGPPRQIVFDGAFASRENLVAIKQLGVTDVAFSKAATIPIRDQTRSPRTHHVLKKFRAGIEGCISFLKRATGLDRCTWRGEESFASYVWAGIVAGNLLTVARHLLEAT